MAKANLLNTGTATYLELIGNGRVYTVPAYQRDYSWTSEQWEDLWTDLVELAERPDDSHYMGALVVENRSDRDFAVIDGQQRLATLSLLVLAVIDRLGELARQGVDAAANQERAQALRSRFVGEKDPASLVEASKLTLNDTDNAFYQDFLVQLRAPRSARARIAVDNELNAYTVFETLNARGLELSATDLLKNYLFSQLRTAADLESLQQRWRNLVAIVQQERFPEFLRYHLQCELPRVRTQRLFKLMRDRVRSGEDTFALLDALERRADIFAALFDPDHVFWIERPESRPFIRELNAMRVRQMTPLVFAAWETMSLVDFARVLKLLVAVLFRYSAVGSLNTNALELVFHEAARGVLERRLATPAHVFEALRGVYIDDTSFEQQFTFFAPDSAGQGNKLVRYVLGKLEADARGQPFDPDADPGSIEHVLPQNPTGVWEPTFPRDAWERSIDRLGNLTWLEPAVNRALGNADIERKVEAYRASRYALTQRLPEVIGDAWTPARLEARQAAMARRAVHVWRSDFA